MLLSTSAATGLEPPRGRAAKRRGRGLRTNALSTSPTTARSRRMVSGISAGRDRACGRPRHLSPLCRSFTATALCGYLVMSPPGSLDGNLAAVAMGARHAVDRNLEPRAQRLPERRHRLQSGAPRGNIATVKRSSCKRRHSHRRMRMKRTLLAMTAALALARRFPTMAGAQGHAGGGGGAAAGGGGGGGGVLGGRRRWRRRWRFHRRSSRRRRGTGSNRAAWSRRRRGTGGRQYRGTRRRQFGRAGNWHARRHHRGPFITGFGAPYFYDYATPYGDDGCWDYRFVRGAYRRVWVCY